MKHLRRFDEELDPTTYRRAGQRLIGKFKEERGRKLVDYGNEKEFGFYNMYFANVNGKIGKDYSLKFTNPKADFYFQNVDQMNVDANGNAMLRSKSADDLVNWWKKGDNLCFTICFRFFASEESKAAVDHHSSLVSSKGAPMFSFKVRLSDWFDGIEEWNTDESIGDGNIGNLIGTDREHDTYEMFENTFCPQILLERPADKHYYGIFSDRASALKFKRQLPSLIEPFEGHIHDIISAIGGESEHLDKIMDLFKNISLNGLYDDEKSPNVPNGDYSRRWFNNNKLA